jgi:hypothetical protein
VLETPIGVVADLILQTGTGRIPVVDPSCGTVCGIGTRHDLLKARGSIRAEETLRGGCVPQLWTRGTTSAEPASPRRRL